MQTIFPNNLTDFIIFTLNRTKISIFKHQSFEQGLLIIDFDIIKWKQHKNLQQQTKDSEKFYYSKTCYFNLNNTNSLKIIPIFINNIKMNWNPNQLNTYAAFLRRHQHILSSGTRKQKFRTFKLIYNELRLKTNAQIIFFHREMLRNFYNITGILMRFQEDQGSIDFQSEDQSDVDEFIHIFGQIGKNMAQQNSQQKD